MKLGFHYHIPTMKKDGKIYIPGYLGVFIDSLANYFDEIICFMHIPFDNEKKLLDYQIKSNNVKLIHIGFHEHMLKRGFFPNKYLVSLKKNIKDIDLMLLRGPTPLLPAIVRICKNNNTPFSYLLVGDYLEGLASTVNMNILKKKILYTFYKNNKMNQDKYITNEPIFVNSIKLFEEYDKKVTNCIQVKTTTLSNNDFFYRENTCLDEKINLLYTGRIDPTKGISDIFNAVAILKKEGIKNIIINLVGWETKKGFLNELSSLAKKLDIEDNYIFHGKKSVGKELFDMYKKSDIYVIASRGDFEGFPRTLWEAMANSLPIIATKVGSIPYFLSNDNSILIPPNRVDEIKKAIQSLINNKKLRANIIKNAIELAKTNTLEIQSSNLAEKIKGFLNAK